MAKRVKIIHEKYGNDHEFASLDEANTELRRVFPEWPQITFRPCPSVPSLILDDENDTVGLFL